MAISKEQLGLLGKILEGEWARLAYIIDKEPTENGKEALRKAQAEIDALYYALNPKEPQPWAISWNQKQIAADAAAYAQHLAETED